MSKSIPRFGLSKLIQLLKGQNTEQTFLRPCHLLEIFSFRVLYSSRPIFRKTAARQTLLKSFSRVTVIQYYSTVLAT